MVCLEGIASEPLGKSKRVIVEIRHLWGANGGEEHTEKDKGRQKADAETNSGIDGEALEVILPSLLGEGALVFA